MRYALVFLLLATACGDETTAPPDNTVTIPEGWSSLVAGSWELASGTEDYVCVRHTITEDTYIGGLQAVNPLGTHHTVLTVGSPSGSDATYPCNTSENHDVMLYGSGVGTNPIEFPEGVAFRIAAGQQLLLNLHIFNAGTTRLTGESGIIMKPVAEADVQEEAEAILAGTFGVALPSMSQPQKVTGRCTVSAATRVFAVGPHMHQLATHSRVVALRDAGDVVLHDRAFDFNTQLLYEIDPLTEMAAGDAFRVECTYVNNTGNLVTWGESSNQEMCFATMFLAPPIPEDFVCND